MPTPDDSNHAGSIGHRKPPDSGVRADDVVPRRRMSNNAPEGTYYWGYPQALSPSQISDPGNERFVGLDAEATHPMRVLGDGSMLASAFSTTFTDPVQPVPLATIQNFADRGTYRQHSEDQYSDSAYHSPPSQSLQTSVILDMRRGTVSENGDGSQFRSRGTSPVSDDDGRTHVPAAWSTPASFPEHSYPPGSLSLQDHRTAMVLDQQDPLPSVQEFSALLDNGNSGAWERVSRLLSPPTSNSSLGACAEMRGLSPGLEDGAITNRARPQHQCQDNLHLHISVDPVSVHDSSYCQTPVQATTEAPRVPELSAETVSLASTNPPMQHRVKASMHPRFSAFEQVGGGPINMDSADNHLPAHTFEEPGQVPSIANANFSDGGGHLQALISSPEALGQAGVSCRSPMSESGSSSSSSYSNTSTPPATTPISPNDDMIQTLFEERKRRMVDHAMDHFWELFEKLELECPRSPSTFSDDDADSITSESSIGQDESFSTDVHSNGLPSGWQQEYCGQKTAPGDPCDGAGEGHEYGLGAVNFPFNSSSSSSQDKRKADDIDPSDGEDGPNGNKKQKPDPPGDPDSPSQGDKGRRFGCPYYKRQSMRSGNTSPKSTSCVFPGFSSISRLKEHLYRHHRRPIHCPRCFERFNAEVLLIQHLNAEEICRRAQNPPSMEGFDKDQEVELKSKRRSKEIRTNEAKWKVVYKILFPEDMESMIPGPYCDHEPGDGNIPNSDELAEYDAFSRQELPRLVREELERAINEDNVAMEGRLLGNLVNIIRNCQEAVSANYRQATASPARLYDAALRSTPQAGRTTNEQTVAVAHTERVPAVVQAPPTIQNEEASVPTIEETRLSQRSSGSPKDEADSGYGPSLRSRLPGSSAAGSSRPSFRSSNNDAHPPQHQFNFMVQPQYSNIDSINQQAYNGTLGPSGNGNYPRSQFEFQQLSAVTAPNMLPPVQDFSAPLLVGDSFGPIPFGLGPTRQMQSSMYPQQSGIWPTSTSSNPDGYPIDPTSSEELCANDEYISAQYGNVRLNDFANNFGGENQGQPPR